MRKTSAGIGLKNISSQLNTNPGVRPAAAAKGSESFEEFSSRLDKIEKAQDVMRYGGTGGGRKLLFGATSSIVGEKNAEKVARKFGNKKLQEEAFQTLYGDRGDKNQSGGGDTAALQQQSEKINKKLESTKKSINNKTERVVKAELKKVIDQVKEALKDIPEIKETIDRIEKRISPRDMTVGKGQNAQTFRFDPLSPEGKQVTGVQESGLAGGIASKEGGGNSDYQKVLSKAAFLGNQDLVAKKEQQDARKLNDNLELTSKPSGQKLDKIDKATAKGLVEQIKKELQDEGLLLIASKKEPSGGEAPQGRGDQQDDPNRPKNFEEYSKRKDEIEKAQDVMRYGSKSKLKKVLFGATKMVVGEKNSLKIARKFGDKDQQEAAFQTLNGEANPKTSEASAQGDNPNKSEVTPNNDTSTQQLAEQGAAQDNDTSTQQLAEQGAAQAAAAQSAESSGEDRKMMIDKLDEILKKLEEMQDGKGGLLKALLGGLMGSLLGGIGKLLGPLMKLAGPIAAIAGAGAAGYAVGKGIDKGVEALTGKAASDWAASGVGAVTGQNAEGNKAAHAGEGSANSKISEKLKGTGYELVGPGKYKGPDGKVVGRKDLPPEVSAKLGSGPAGPATAAKQESAPTATSAPAPAPTATPAPAPAAAANKQEQQVAPLSSENASLKEDKPAQVSVVNSQPQGELPKMMKAGFDAVMGKLNKSTQPEYIQVRNDEISVSTYVASIFDHPVVHPGIYKM